MRARVVTAALALLAVLCGLALGASSANAARVPVSAGSAATLTSYAACATAMAAGRAVIDSASVSSSSISLSDVPASCVGLPIEVFAHNSSGGVIASGSATSAATSQEIATGTYTPADVSTAMVKIDGWVFPTTWTTPTPPVSNACVGLDVSGKPTPDACKLTVTNVNSWTDRGFTYVQVYFTAETAAPLWQVTLDLSTFTTPSITPKVVGSHANVALASGYSCSQLPVFVGIEANPAWSSTSGTVTFSDDPASSDGTRLCPAP